MDSSGDMTCKKGKYEVTDPNLSSQITSTLNRFNLIFFSKHFLFQFTLEMIKAQDVNHTLAFHFYGFT